MRSILLVVPLMAATALSHAEIFRWTDPDGIVHYSDSAPGDLQVTRLQAPHLSLIQSQPAPKSRAPRTIRQSSGRAHRLHGRAPDASLAECQRVKRRALLAQKRDRLKGDDALDSWLWKNCRSWSRELRKVAQDLM